MSNFYFFCKFCPKKFLSLKISRKHGCNDLGLSFALKKENRNIKVVKNIQFECDSVKAADITKEDDGIEAQSSTKVKVQIVPTEKSISQYIIAQTNDTKLKSFDVKFENQTQSSFPCSICQKILTSNDNLEIHLKIHTIKQILSCQFPDCEQTFTTQNFLWEHMLNIHRVNKGSWQSRRFQCNDCEKVFNRKDKLKEHEIKHTDEKPFKCTICSKCFKKKKGLHFHTLRHQGAFDFKCSDCGKSYVSKSELKLHISAVHSLQDKYKCDQCTSDFTTKGQLTVHMTKHTGVKAHKCREGCNKQFRIAARRTNHEKTHKGIKEFQCSKCPKMFTLSCHMRRHIRRHEERKDHVCVVCNWAYVEAASAKKCKHSRGTLNK